MYLIAEQEIKTHPEKEKQDQIYVLNILLIYSLSCRMTRA